MDITKTPSAISSLGITGSEMLTPETYVNLINAYGDEVMEGTYGTIEDEQLMGLFLIKDQKQDIYKIKTKMRPGGVVPLSRDGDDLTFMTAVEGFPYELRTYQYRLAIKHERKLEEVDDIGTITSQYDWLMDASKRTLKYAMADVFNRGVDPTTAPFLCPDGLALIDSGRPNPDPKVPTWSNLEASSAITEEALFTAHSNAWSMTDAKGDPLRQKIQKIYIPQSAERLMWQLLKTDKKIGSANNDANWAAGRFDFEVMDELTSDSIFYMVGDAKSNDNGLQFRFQKRPSLADLNFENPDIMGKRIRFSFGIGCLDPRYVWRGGALTGL